MKLSFQTPKQGMPRNVLLFNRDTNNIAPLGPGTIVIAYTRIAQQLCQDKPGMGRTLTNTTIGNDLVIWCYPFATIDLAKFLRRFEGTVRIGRDGPRNIFCSRDMTTTLCTFLRIVDHMQQFATILLWRAHIN